MEEQEGTSWRFTLEQTCKAKQANKALFRAVSLQKELAIAKFFGLQGTLCNDIMVSRVEIEARGS